MIGKLSAALCMGLALGGCAFHEPLKRVAVDHNRMIAESGDELALLNILRSKYRMPMHFSTVTAVHGDVSLQVAGSLGANLAEKGPDSYSGSLGATVSTNPSFDAAVLDSEKFQRGVLRPIDQDVIAFLLESGYPDDLIMSLFIKRVDFIAGKDGFPRIDAGAFDPAKGFSGVSAAGGSVAEGELVGSIINDPNRAYSFGRFTCYYAISVGSTPVPSRPVLTWPDTMKEWPALFNSGELKDYPYSVVHDAKAGQVSVMAPDAEETGIFIRRLDGENGRCPADTAHRGASFGANFVENGLGQHVLMGYDYNQALITNMKQGSSELEVRIGGKLAGKLVAKARLRSVNDVFYFLGEYLRADDPYEIGTTFDRPDSAFCSSFGKAPTAQYRVFRADPVTAGSNPLIRARYAGKQFGIAPESQCPAWTGDRSTTTLALIEQLLNLYKSYDTLPQSGTIRLIGR